MIEDGKSEEQPDASGGETETVLERMRRIALTPAPVVRAAEAERERRPPGEGGRKKGAA